MTKDNNRVVIVALLCTVFCFAWSTQERVQAQVKPKEVLELRQKAEECSKETGVPADHLKKIIDKSLPDDKASKQFFYCVIHGTGYILENGLFSPERMLVLKLVNGTEEKLVNDLNECNKIKKEDNIETAFAISNCVHDKYKFTVLTQKKI